MSPLRMSTTVLQDDNVTFTTLGFLGCGDIGSAILKNLCYRDRAREGCEDTVLPTRFLVSVRSAESADRLRREFKQLQSNLEFFQGANLEVVERSDIVLLACRPDAVKSVLSETGVCEALRGKLLISIAAGWTSSEIKKTLGSLQSKSSLSQKQHLVVRVMPNAAASVSQSMTAIELCDPPLPKHYQQYVNAIFGKIGETVHLQSTMLDAATALCGSTPAFLSMICEGLVDGAVAMGIPREQAKIMTYQALLGTAVVLKGGEHPAILKEKSTSPGGCTIGAIMGLEEAGIRGIMAKAVRDSTSIAALLGQGYANVNGTR